MSWEMHEAAKKIADGWYSELETTRKRNAVLERENAKLRNEVDNLLDFEHLASVAVAYAGCDECGEYKQTMLRLFAENAKMRKLLQDAWGLHQPPRQCHMDAQEAQGSQGQPCRPHARAGSGGRHMSSMESLDKLQDELSGNVYGDAFHRLYKLSQDVSVEHAELMAQAMKWVHKEKVEPLEAENAKLRELLHEALLFGDERSYQEIRYRLKQQASELGVEVES